MNRFGWSAVLVLVAVGCGPRTPVQPVPDVSGVGDEAPSNDGQSHEGEVADDQRPESESATTGGDVEAAAGADEAEAGSGGETAPAEGETAAAETAAPPACKVSGRATVRDLSVAIEGERRPRRFASIAGVFDATLPERRTAATHVVVREPLSFEGETRAAIPYAIARPLDLASGAIHVAQATPLTRVVVDGADVRVDADLAEGVSVSDLPVPCGALTLHATAPAAPATIAEEGLLSRGGQLRLYTAPTDEEPAIIVRIRRPTEVVLTETARRDGWVRVWRSFDTGASLVGWVPESAVRAMTAPPRARAREVREARERVPPPCEPAALAGFYLGPARITPNTEVRTASDGAVWARTAVRDVTVRTLEDPAWVAIVAIQGVESTGRCPAYLDAAVIPRASVTFPSASRLPGAMHEGAVRE